MRNDFSKKQHLVEDKQFRRVFNQKQKITTDAFRVYYCNNNLTHPRLGVIVAKKNISKAVARNHLKRLVREFFRLNKDKIGAIDLVIFVNKRALDLTKKELEQQLDRIIEYLKNCS